jgi:hypothetical protein
MKMSFGKEFSILCMISFGLFGCSPPKLNITKQVEGEYAFQYRTGEIEVLQLYSNMTYKQELYNDFISYQKHATPRYINSNVWTHVGNLLKMMDFVVFCDLAIPQRRLDPPKKFAYVSKLWLGPMLHSRAAVEMNPDEDYYLIRVGPRDKVVFTRRRK